MSNRPTAGDSHCRRRVGTRAQKDRCVWPARLPVTTRTLATRRNYQSLERQKVLPSNRRHNSRCLSKQPFGCLLQRVLIVCVFVISRLKSHYSMCIGRKKNNKNSNGSTYRCPSRKLVDFLQFSKTPKSTVSTPLCFWYFYGSIANRHLLSIIFVIIKSVEIGKTRYCSVFCFLASQNWL